jgi:hypothetical protein
MSDEPKANDAYRQPGKVPKDGKPLWLPEAGETVVHKKTETVAKLAVGRYDEGTDVFLWELMVGGVRCGQLRTEELRTCFRPVSKKGRKGS